MKIWLSEAASPESGGMYRVYQGLYTHLPQHGIEIVNKMSNADVVHAHIGLWSKVPDDKPLVVSSHGMLWKEHQWGKIAHKVNKECLEAYRRADVVTAPSQFVARSIARYTGAPVRVVQHGIDVNEWTPGESLGYALWNKSREDIASNPDEMNKLAALAPEIPFYTTFGKEEHNVFVTGKISPENMQYLVQQAGVYLALSKESGGPCFGVLEAMACGVPVLAWDFGGTSEILEHGVTGYLAEPGNYEDLEHGLRACLTNRDTWGKNAREVVSALYTWDKVIPGYIDAYTKALQHDNQTVSVIIPCYNLGTFLPHCLDSVLTQTYTDLEILVVDDASTDNSWEIIQKYAKRDKRIIPLRNATNQHVSFSRNKAVKRASGQYILPLDADDALYPDAVETLVSFLQTNRNFDIAAGKLHVYHETALDGPFQASGWPNNAELKLQLEGYNRLPYSSLYRRKVWERTGGYRTRIRNGTEDADYWTRALSLGYKAEVLDKYTLRYTHRENSLGKQNSHGSVVWTSWFPWNIHTVPANITQVESLDEPVVSVIIPVGPGHLPYLQACIDSLISQSEQRWEAVVINDTGIEWGEQLPFPGMGFVHFIDSPTNRGVAWARNRGIEAARSDRIVFLDVDDVLQPTALEVLIKAHDYADGWIYGDWYTCKENTSPEYSEAYGWDYDLILQHSLGPITGIYRKDHLMLVGGFTEDAPGWEDWDLQLKLLHEGICGTRIKFPLISYNMHLGYRREDNFSHRENLVEYIRRKHFNTLKDKKSMACNSCGGKRTLTVKSATLSATGSTVIMDDVVQLQYMGNNAGRERITSPTHKGTSYTFSSGSPLAYVFKSDLDKLLSYRIPGTNDPLFTIVPKSEQKQETVIVESGTPLVSEEPRQAEIPNLSIDALPLEEHVVTKLRKGGIDTLRQLQEASDTDLLAIKGIGQQRVDEIREVAHQWISS